MAGRNDGVRWHDPAVGGTIGGVYSRDDFTNNVPTWRRHVIPYLDSGTRRCLFVGSADEGLPLVFVSNELKHVTRATLDVLVPPIGGLGGAEAARARATLSHLRANVRRHVRDGFAVEIHVGDIERALMTRALRGAAYDLVFIGGGAKDSPTVLRLAASAFVCTGPGGMTVYDNYTSNVDGDRACPREGIDAFVSTHRSLLKAVGPWSWQAIVVRRRRPLEPRGRRGCASEFYHEDLSRV